MARIIGIEYEVHDELSNTQWVQFGGSENDLAYRGYPSEGYDPQEDHSAEIITEARLRNRQIINAAKDAAALRLGIEEGEA